MSRGGKENTSQVSASSRHCLLSIMPSKGKGKEEGRRGETKRERDRQRERERARESYKSTRDFLSLLWK